MTSPISRSRFDRILKRFREIANTLGAGPPVPIGPGFVGDNAARVAAPVVGHPRVLRSGERAHML